MTERRFKPLTEEELTPEQRRAAEAIKAGPRGSIQGPFNALLRSPDLADRVQRVGEYIRFNSSLPARLNELAILITAREWGAQFEWWAHHRFAMEAGLEPEVAAAVAEGKRPEGMKEDEAIVYDFCRELLSRRHVSDATFARAKAAFGERGVIDLIGASGYYGLVSMILNVERYPLPEGVEPPLKPLAS